MHTSRWGGADVSLWNIEGPLVPCCTADEQPTVIIPQACAAHAFCRPLTPLLAALHSAARAHSHACMLTHWPCAPFAPDTLTPSTHLPALPPKFLIEELKPHIDSSYRTIPDAAHTAISGSSMGGLISCWALMRYPLVGWGAVG